MSSLLVLVCYTLKDNEDHKVACNTQVDDAIMTPTNSHRNPEVQCSIHNTWERWENNIQKSYGSRCRSDELDVIRINLPLFSTVFPSNSRLFLSCRPFVVITTFSTGLVGVEVTSVSFNTHKTC